MYCISKCLAVCQKSPVILSNKTQNNFLFKRLYLTASELFCGFVTWFAVVMVFGCFFGVIFFSSLGNDPKGTEMQDWTHICVLLVLL